MIDPNELMRGNYVHDEVLGVCAVADIVDNKIWVIAKQLSANGEISDVKYITFAGELTSVGISEEILQKLGVIKDNYGVFYFTKDGTNTYYSDLVFYLKECVVDNKNVWDCSIGQFGDTENVAYINYVHELQNIFYIRTKIKLIFKL